MIGKYAKAIAAAPTALVTWIVMNVSLVETEAGTMLQMPLTGEFAEAIATGLAVAGVVWGVPNKDA